MQIYHSLLCLYTAKLFCLYYRTAARKEFVDEKIPSGAIDIAYVDLNTTFVEWNKHCQTRNTTTTAETRFSDTTVDKRAMDYYYVCDRSVGVDTIHINDLEADNAAYIFVQKVKKL